MDINISGRNIEIGQAFHGHAADRIRGAAQKYFEHSIDATVTVSKEGPMYHVECNLHIPHGVNMHSRAEAPEVYASFDQAAEKLEKQLRRFKRRIKNHHDSARGAEDNKGPETEF